MVEARYYRKEESYIICELCPHHCKIADKECGLCGVRTNHNGILISDNYGLVSALNMDPIEKKPLYHFLPGTKILSIGSYGCNLKCNFCQNHTISQIDNKLSLSGGKYYSTDNIVELANGRTNNIGLAFTYNEPAVWFEFMYDIASKIAETNLITTMISNGYINEKPLKDLIPLIDAFNIDLKAFNNSFYRAETGASLKPVLRTLKTISESEKHLEITMLVIPGLNDDLEEFEQMTKWIATNCGRDTVLHLSRYFPSYKSNRNITPIQTIRSMYDIAKAQLNFVYPGNIPTYDW